MLRSRNFAVERSNNLANFLGVKMRIVSAPRRVGGPLSAAGKDGFLSRVLKHKKCFRSLNRGCFIRIGGFTTATRVVINRNAFGAGRRAIITKKDASNRSTTCNSAYDPHSTYQLGR